MPSFNNGDATIYYEEYGHGFPILTFAPGGMTSTIDFWRHPAAPVDPTAVFASDYRVIAMDQRNAGGQSHAPIRDTDGWQSFASDHIALLDHLGIERCHLYGQCIGGPFILSLLRAQPQRIVSAILAQPIGRIGPLPAQPSGNFVSWTESLTGHPEATPQVLDAYHNNLYAPDFAYSVDRDFVRTCQTPCLVLAGNDEAHPFAIADEIANLLPNAEFIPDWKQGEPLEVATQRMRQFLADQTPVPFESLGVT